MASATVTSKGQAPIPRKVLEALLTPLSTDPVGGGRQSSTHRLGYHERASELDVPALT
jgi:hypothetical protein